MHDAFIFTLCLHPAHFRDILVTSWPHAKRWFIWNYESNLAESNIADILWVIKHLIELPFVYNLSVLTGWKKTNQRRGGKLLLHCSLSDLVKKCDRLQFLLTYAQDKAKKCKATSGRKRCQSKYRQCWWHFFHVFPFFLKFEQYFSLLIQRTCCLTRHL